MNWFIGVTEHYDVIYRACAMREREAVALDSLKHTSFPW